MVRQLDIEQIVPQHGARFVGRQAVQDFISWVEGLSAGGPDDSERVSGSQLKLRPATI